jgi:hypothetical protein
MALDIRRINRYLSTSDPPNSIYFNLGVDTRMLVDTMYISDLLDVS